MRLIGVLVFAITANLVSGEQPWLTFAEFRESHGLSLPVWDRSLAESCEARAKALADEGALSHQDSRGRGPGLQMIREGLPPGIFGEVLAAGTSWPEVWSSWLNSSTHRQTLSEVGWARWALASTEAGATRVWVLRLWKP